MNKIVKKALVSLGVAAFVVGIYTGYQAVEGWMDNKIAIERDKIVRLEKSNDAYKAEAMAEIASLDVEIIGLKAKNIALSEENVHHETVITGIRASITDLEDAAVVQTDINAKYDNAMAQIFEYKKVVAEYDADIAVYKDRLITQGSVIKATEETSKRWQRLYLNEVHLTTTLKAELGATRKRLAWEKVKFKGSAVILAAAAGVALWGVVT